MEVEKSPKRLAAYRNTTVGQAVKSPDKLQKVIYHRKEIQHPFQILVTDKISLLYVGAVAWQIK